MVGDLAMRAGLDVDVAVDIVHDARLTAQGLVGVRVVVVVDYVLVVAWGRREGEQVGFTGWRSTSEQRATAVVWCRAGAGTQGNA